MRTALVVLAFAATAGELVGQTLRATVEGSGARVRARSQLSSGTVVLSGAAFGGTGAVSVGRWQLSLGYLQGKVDPDGGGAPSRDLVEGGAMLAFRLGDWLTLGAGPQARSYVSSGVTQRWLFWEVRARAERTFIGSAVNGYAELWRAVTASVNVPDRFDQAQGGEAGMTLRISRGLEARVAYRIDHATLGGGSRVETVDAIVVGFGVAGR